MKRVLLFSGGMDSAAMAAWLRPELLLTVDYGQAPASGEIRAASAISEGLRLKHEVLRVDCSVLGSGDLAGTPHLSVAPASDWWPFRNQLLITLAATRALVIGADELLIGTVKSDHGHADGTPAFVEALARLLALQEGGLRLVAPAIEKSTTQLVRESGIPFTLLRWAHSCHTSGWSCGRCRGCTKYIECWNDLEGAGA